MMFLMAAILRPLTRADVPGAMALVHQVGWNQTAADWERLLRAQPDGCFVASVGDELVGTVTTIVYDRRLAWIGMMVVAVGYRGQGFGQRLLARALEFLDRSGISCVKLDATPEGRGLYEKHGFVDERAVERWALARPAGAQASAETVPRIRSGQGQLTPPIEDVLVLDAELFGADRRDLLRSLAADAPDLAVVLERDAELIGYAFGRRGLRADHLGPWMARDECTADLLLTSFLQRSARPLVFVDCVRDNPWARRLAAARGFTLSRPLTRMYRGANVMPDATNFLGAIVGFEFG
jgi:GNAT superfamily N-acetyltransferase